jgi:simple sugar transport system permease protein
MRPKETGPLLETVFFLLRRIGTSLLLILVAFVLTGFLIYFSGYDPVSAFANLLYGAFGNKPGFSNTLVRYSPLLFAGLGVAVAFKCGVWNIGAEGQLYMGALGSTIVGLKFGFLPTWLHLPFAVLTGFVFGGVWGLIAGALKAKLQINEIISTLMMNFIAIWFVAYMVHFPLRSPTAYNPITPAVLASARLPRPIAGTPIHSGIFLGLVLAIVLYVIIEKTSFGYSLKASGISQEAARYGGVPVERTIMLVMFLSGGLAGLGGMGEVLGFRYYLMENISLDFGYIAIAVALLAGLHPLGVIITALFFGGLVNGASYMQHTVGISSTLIRVTQGAVVLFVALGPFVGELFSRFRLKSRHREMPLE